MKHRSAWALLVGMGAVVGATAFATKTSAAPDQVIQYQGRLVDSNGVPLEGQVGQLSFRIYSTAAPSSASFVWGETHSNVRISRGVFTVSLGSGARIDEGGNPVSGTAFTDEFDGSPRFIQIQVNADAPLAPLSPIGAVPYAISAGGSVPIGTVLQWWPPAPGASPPPGFEYCDGTAVTTVGSPVLNMTKPDLMGTERFVRGLSMAAVPSYGGSNALSYGGGDSVADHTHAGGDHRHQLVPGGGRPRTTSAGDHNHGGRTGPELNAGTFLTSGELYFPSGTSDHNHMISSGGAHQHDVDATETGPVLGASTVSGPAGAHDNRPAFVALVFIVRVL